MKILSIETSCDETGIAVLEQTAQGVIIRGNALASQIELHAKFGGVFPMMAKRAHAEKITLLISQALDEADLLEAVETPTQGTDTALAFLHEKESALFDHIAPFLTFYQKPEIDYIAVTVGPGLEPALWVGINAARALSTIWNIPIIPINHMEGHIVTAAVEKLEDLPAQVDNMYDFAELKFPLLALLVSGGHTELVVASTLGSYTKIGSTRDDAVGEAFDKVARMLGLPYPGGPAVSALARDYRTNHLVVGLPSEEFRLPRPMLHSGDFDFSFSGIKTAVLYAIRDLGRELTNEDKMTLACAFEDAVVEVLIHKTLKAAKEHHIQTIVVGGGVASNSYLRSELMAACKQHAPEITLLFPEPWLATDNAVMIGLAAMTHILSEQIKTSAPELLVADGNLSL